MSTGSFLPAASGDAPTTDEWRALARSAPWLWDALDADLSYEPGSGPGPRRGPWRVRYRSVRGIVEPHVTGPDGAVLQESRRALAIVESLAHDAAPRASTGVTAGAASPSLPADLDRWGPRDSSPTIAFLGSEDTTPAQMLDTEREAERERRDSWDDVPRVAEGPAAGLVARRPFLGPPDPPFFRDYHIAAMLDPAELTDGDDPETGAPPTGEPALLGTEVWDVRVGEVGGREVWWAKVAPAASYAPRCSCCALLMTTALVTAEWGEEGARESGWTGPDADPLHAEVAVDRATGVVVRLRIVGGHDDGDEYRIDIHAAAPAPLPPPPPPPAREIARTAE